jgi:glyoxylate reductase
MLVKPMPTPRIYVARLLPEPVMAEIRSRLSLINDPTSASPTATQLREGLHDAEAAICTLTEPIGPEEISRASRLRILANCAVGYNNIDLPAARSRGIVVTNTPDVLTDATADLAWALLLAVARRVVEGDRLARSGRWTGWEPTQLLGAEVTGATLGIVGMGRIGQAVARRAGGFGMRILYASRSAIRSKESDAWERTSLERLLAESDFVSLHVPLAAETRHLIGPEQLAGMKPTTYLINTSRGPVVDETALVEALEAGRLAGAGLDVYEQEPSIHPSLRTNPRVVLLPHLGSATARTRIRMGLMCLENVMAVLEGRPAPNRVA